MTSNLFFLKKNESTKKNWYVVFRPPSSPIPRCDPARPPSSLCNQFLPHASPTSRIFLRHPLPPASPSFAPPPPRLRPATVPPTNPNPSPSSSLARSPSVAHPRSPPLPFPSPQSRRRRPRGFVFRPTSPRVRAPARPPGPTKKIRPSVEETPPPSSPPGPRVVVHYHAAVGHAHHAITVAAVDNAITVAAVDHSITDASLCRQHLHQDRSPPPPSRVTSSILSTGHLHHQSSSLPRPHAASCAVRSTPADPICDAVPSNLQGHQLFSLRCLRRPLPSRSRAKAQDTRPVQQLRRPLRRQRQRHKRRRRGHLRLASSLIYTESQQSESLQW